MLALAFLRRDAIIAYSYRVSFVAQLMGNLLVLGLFYYVGRAIGNQPLPAFAPYGGSFVAFLLIGIALTDCVGVSLVSRAPSDLEVMFGLFVVDVLANGGDVLVPRLPDAGPPLRDLAFDCVRTLA